MQSQGRRCSEAAAYQFVEELPGFRGRYAALRHTKSESTLVWPAGVSLVVGGYAAHGIAEVEVLEDVFETLRAITHWDRTRRFARARGWRRLATLAAHICGAETGVGPASC